jgi:acyl carrier protein
MKEKLIELSAEILETDASELTLDTPFKDDRFLWDSLKGFAMLIMLEEDFDTRVSVDDFIAASTLRDLLAHIEKDLS